MGKLIAPYLQHRNSIGYFNQSQTKKQPSQKQQEKHSKQLAAQPGLHQGNIHKKRVAYAMVQLLTVLSSVRNSNKMMDVTVKNRNPSAVSLSGHQNAERGMFIVSSVQNRNIVPSNVISVPNSKNDHKPGAAREVVSMNDLLQESNSDNFGLTSAVTQITPTFRKGLDMVVAALHQVDHFLESYDPLKFPGTMAKAIPPHRETLVSDSTPHLHHAHRLSPIEIEQKKKQLLDYFFAEGYSNETLFSQREVAVATLSTLFFRADASSLLKHPEEIRVLAKHILAEQDLYGGKEEEALSLRQAEAVFSSSMFYNILSMEFEDYVIRKITMDEYPTYFSVGSLQYVLSPDMLRNTKQFHLHNIPNTEWDNFSRMWFFCLHQRMPFLKLKEAELNDILLSEDNFAALYAGSQFLDEAADKDPFYTLEEAIKTGREIWNIALSEKEITQDKIRYFRVPALVFMAQKAPQRINQEKNLEKIGLVAINEYMQYLGDIDTLSKNITQKYENYQSAFAAWMSKKKLSEKVVAELPLKTLYLYFPKLKTIQDEKGKEALLRSAHLDMEKRYLESGSLDSRYDKLTADVADSFYEFDKYLIESALLKDNEFYRIFSSDAILRPVFFNMEVFGSGAYAGHAVVPIMYHVPKDVIRVRLEKTDLIAVSVKGEERIYALKADQNIQEGYRLIQVDRDILRYIGNDLLDDKELGSNYTISGDKVITNKGEFSVTIRTEMDKIICKGGETDKLVEFLGKKHHKELYDLLHKSGDYETENQKAWNVVQHIIPFYDCVDGIIRKDYVQATPACFYDSVLTVPVVGAAGSLSQKFGMSLAKGIVKGMSKNGMTLTKHSFSTLAAATAREISLPTTFELVSLGKMALRSVDPGIELLTGVSKKLSKKVAMRLSGDKKTADFAKKIDSVQSFEEVSPELKMQIKTALLPDSNIRVTVKKIGQDGLDDIYAQINPDTGEIFGYRYKIDEKNTLVRRVGTKPVQPKTNKKEIETLGRSEEGSHVKDTISPYISKELEKHITPEMYEKNIDENLLLPPDRYGLRKNADGNTVLKVKDGYIEITKLNGNRFALGSVYLQDRMVLRFRDDQFFLEKASERLQNILDVGLSGRGAIRKEPALKAHVSLIKASEMRSSFKLYSKLLSQIAGSLHANSIAQRKITLPLGRLDCLLSELLALPNLKIASLLMRDRHVMLSGKDYYRLLIKSKSPVTARIPREVILPYKTFCNMVGYAVNLPDLKIEVLSTVRTNIFGLSLSREELKREGKLLSEEINSVKTTLEALSMKEPEVKLPVREFNKLSSAYLNLFNENVIRIPLIEHIKVELPLREFDHLLSVILELPYLDVGTLLMMRKPTMTLSTAEFITLFGDDELDFIESKAEVSPERFFRLVSNKVDLTDLKINNVPQDLGVLREVKLGDVLLDLPDLNLPNLKIGDFSRGEPKVELPFIQFAKMLSKYIDLFDEKKINVPLLARSDVTLSLMEFNHLLSTIIDLPSLKLSTFVTPESLIKLSPTENYRLAVRNNQGSRNVKMLESKGMLSRQEFYERVSETLELAHLKIGTSSIVKSKNHREEAKITELTPAGPLIEIESKLKDRPLFGTVGLRGVTLMPESEVRLSYWDFSKLISKAVDLPNAELTVGSEITLLFSAFDRILSEILELPNLKIGTLLMTKSKITLSPMEYYKLAVKYKGLDNVKMPRSETTLSHKKFYKMVSKAIMAEPKTHSTRAKTDKFESKELLMDELSFEDISLSDPKIVKSSEIVGPKIQMSQMEYGILVYKYKKIHSNIAVFPKKNSNVVLKMSVFDEMVSEILELPNLKITAASMVKRPTIKMTPSKLEKDSWASNICATFQMTPSELQNKLLSNAADFGNPIISTSSVLDFKIKMPSRDYYKLVTKALEALGTSDAFLDKSILKRPEIEVSLEKCSELISIAVGLPNLKIEDMSIIERSQDSFSHKAIDEMLLSGDFSEYMMFDFKENKGAEASHSEVDAVPHATNYVSLGVDLSGKDRVSPLGKVVHDKDTTLPYISKELEKHITPEMYEKNIDADLVSSLDIFGLWEKPDGNTFLKIKDGYIKIKKLNENRFLLGSTPSHRKMVLRLKNDQFFVETTSERLQHIVEVKSSGVERRIKDPIGVLRALPGFTRESAIVLLLHYQFPETGFYSMYSFVLQIEQTGKIPVWAKRFEKLKVSEEYRSEIIETIALEKPKSSSEESYKHLGSVCNEDESGTVFLDADDTRFVIKRFYQDEFIINFLGKQKIKESVIRQCEDIISYYGVGSATVFCDDIGTYYIRMYNLPGKAIGSLEKGSLPVDAVERFIDMLEKMDGNEIDILHADLNPENVFWDSESQIFYPLVFSRKEDSFEKFLSSLREPDPKEIWDEMIVCIKDKMEK